MKLPKSVLHMKILQRIFLAMTSPKVLRQLSGYIYNDCRQLSEKMNVPIYYIIQLEQMALAAALKGNGFEKSGEELTLEIVGARLLKDIREQHFGAPQTLFNRIFRRV